MRYSVACRFAALLAVAMSSALAGAEELVPYRKRWDIPLKSLDPKDVLTVLDLDRAGLEKVKNAADAGDGPGALTALLDYYRDKFPPPKRQATSKDVIRTADNLCRHVFQWGPYKSAEYGKDINWEIDPANDIEWVAAVYRFYWANALAAAYRATHDDKYAAAFIELATDWIRKHPLEDHTRTHPKYKRWRGFAWLDLQTGIRATKAVSAFKMIVHSKTMTPEFLGLFLASMYDHQRKTELIPMGMVHNKAIFEQRGLLNVCHAFPEFTDTRKWAQLALKRSSQNLLAQTTTDGVQREWCLSYHNAVMRDAVDVVQKAEDLGLEIPADYRRRVRRMYDYTFAMTTPDLADPMFGDTARPRVETADRSTWPRFNVLVQGSKLFDDPKYAARAKLERDKLPDQVSYAFKEAGSYVMRSGWGPDEIYFALHCAPPPLSGHDQKDNGTFEMYAYGRWLITDTGYYTYGGDSEARNWHRQTQVHQTLTVDRKDIRTDGKLLLWKSQPHYDVLVVENPSYDGLTHRRSVWFVDRKFFVILDEAIGNMTGTVRLHFQPATGAGTLDTDTKTFTTRFPDANVLIKAVYPENIEIQQEDGWHAWSYGKREPRKTLSIAHPDPAPAAFVTILMPYRGQQEPVVNAELEPSFEIGSAEARLRVTVADKSWRIGRNIADGSATAR